MKKFLVTFIAGVIFAGAAATSVSAEEYKVQEGDSLWSIAEEYSTTVDDIIDENELDSEMIQPGQKLAIEEKMMYKVQEGDTLGGIAKKFDVKKDDIKDWNNLDSDLIIVGQELDLEDVTVDKDEMKSSDDAASDETTKESSDDADASDEATKESNDESDDNKQDTAKQESEETPTNSDNNEEKSKSDDASEGETVNVSATAYTASCEGCSGVTSTGVDLDANPDKKVIAVDPDVIPLGSKVHVEGYGDAVAADTGGAINGDKIDVHVPDDEEANSWGVKDVEVTILD